MRAGHSLLPHRRHLLTLPHPPRSPLPLVLSRQYANTPQQSHILARRPRPRVCRSCAPKLLETVSLRDSASVQRSNLQHGQSLVPVAIGCTWSNGNDIQCWNCKSLEAWRWYAGHVSICASVCVALLRHVLVWLRMLGSSSGMAGFRAHCEWRISRSGLVITRRRPPPPQMDEMWYARRYRLRSLASSRYRAVGNETTVRAFLVFMRHIEFYWMIQLKAKASSTARASDPFLMNPHRAPSLYSGILVLFHSHRYL